MWIRKWGAAAGSCVELTPFSTALPRACVPASALVGEAADLDVGVGATHSAPDEVAAEHSRVLATVLHRVISHLLDSLCPLGGRDPLHLALQNVGFADATLHTVHRMTLARLPPPWCLMGRKS